LGKVFLKIGIIFDKIGEVLGQSKTGKTPKRPQYRL